MELLSIIAFGLAGSFGHCIGMCSGVILLLQQQQVVNQNRLAWFFIHSGRLFAYGVLGLLVGAAGQGIFSLGRLGALFSLTLAAMAFYMAASVATLLPSPEVLLKGLVSRWGQLMRALRATSNVHPFLLGLAWGFLPCGLVLAALLIAASQGKTLWSGLTMLLFGLSTLPALTVIRLFVARVVLRTWGRILVASLMAMTGFQLAMRGFAVLGLMSHQMLGPFRLW